VAGASALRAGGVSGIGGHNAAMAVLDRVRHRPRASVRPWPVPTVTPAAPGLSKPDPDAPEGLHGASAPDAFAPNPDVAPPRP
jgi:hypothetical protein